MTACNALLMNYRKQAKKTQAEKLNFAGAGKKDVYNISAPFETIYGVTIAGRVEKRDSEHSQVMFFREASENLWERIEEAPVYELQDPFITFIQGELVLGGVEIFPKKNDPERLDWRTVFYKGESLSQLELFFKGPIGMKDIRLKELWGGKILILTRPQGEIGGRGKIGRLLVNDLSMLTIEKIESAPVFEDLFLKEEWGGANEIHQLTNDTAGVLGHIARFDEHGNRQYYSMVFVIDLGTLEASGMRMIAERKDFLRGEAKRPDLKDVVFSGGLFRNGKTSLLYAGISDAEAQKLELEDPFTEYENEGK